MAKRKTKPEKKAKPATAGERIFLRLLDHIYFPQLTDGHRFNLTDLRNGGYMYAGKAYLCIDRAIERAVKAEMERCSAIVLYVAARDQNRWIRNGWDPRKDDE